MVPKVPKEPSNGVYKGTEGSVGKGGMGILGCIGLGSTVGNKGIPPIDILNKKVPKGSMYELFNCMGGSEDGGRMEGMVRGGRRGSLGSNGIEVDGVELARGMK